MTWRFWRSHRYWGTLLGGLAYSQLYRRVRR